MDGKTAPPNTAAVEVLMDLELGDGTDQIERRAATQNSPPGKGWNGGGVHRETDELERERGNERDRHARTSQQGMYIERRRCCVRVYVPRYVCGARPRRKAWTSLFFPFSVTRESSRIPSVW